jgi:hypothetical protein
LDTRTDGGLVPRFYFHLASKDSNIPDDGGKELANMNEAYKHAQKLIDQILFHVGYDDAEAWKVIISNDEDDSQMIVSFPLCYPVSAY